MKIAIVVPIVGNFGRKGFYHSQETGLGKAAVSRGNEVTVYKCVPKRAESRMETERLGGLTVRYIPTMAFGPHGMLDVGLIDQDTEVVFAFSDTQLIIPRLYRYCKRYGMTFIPYVGIAHSYQQNFKSRVMDGIFRVTTLQVYKKVKVLAKTVAAKEELERQGVRDCAVVPVGMDPEALKQDYEKYDRTELRKRWGFQEEDLIISFVARLQPEKHPLEMLDIFSAVRKKNKKLLIVGRGSLEHRLREKIRKMALGRLIVYLPEVRYDEMWQIHYISDYFVNLRPDEIFGMAVMEAVYYKSCVAAVRAPGPDTILKDMRGHYLCDGYEDVIRVIDQNRIDEGAVRESAEKLKKKFPWQICCRYMEETAGEGRALLPEK